VKSQSLRLLEATWEGAKPTKRRGNATWVRLESV